MSTTKHLPKLSPTADKRRLISYGYLLINTICWGASLVIVKPALEFTTPFRFLFYRYLIAAVLSLGFVAKDWPHIKHKPQVINTIIWMELIGLTITLALLYYGLTKTSALEASFLTTTTPIFLVVAGVLFLHERQEKHEWQGLGVAFFGTLLLTLEPLLLGIFSGKGLSGMGNFTTNLFGNLLIVGQNLTTTLYFALAKSRYLGLPKLFVSGISFWVGLISFGLLSWWAADHSLGTLWSQIIADWQHPSVWVASIYMAVFGSIIGLTAYIKGQEGVEASEASLFWYLQPLVYIPLGILLAHEHITGWQISALIFIGLGVWWAEKKYRPKRNSAALK